MTKFREVRTFKGRAVRTKTDREYERLFEDLVEYTSFNSVDDIIGDNPVETQQNLNRFFRDIQSDAKGRGRKFTISFLFKEEFGKAFIRIAKLPRRKTVIVSRKKQVIEGRFFAEFDKAKQDNLTTVNRRGFEVFKTTVTVNKKKVVRFRDQKGRFRSTPKVD